MSLLERSEPEERGESFLLEEPLLPELERPLPELPEEELVERVPPTLVPVDRVPVFDELFTFGDGGRGVS